MSSFVLTVTDEDGSVAAGGAGNINDEPIIVDGDAFLSARKEKMTRRQSLRMVSDDVDSLNLSPKLHRRVANRSLVADDASGGGLMSLADGSKGGSDVEDEEDDANGEGTIDYMSQLLEKAPKDRTSEDIKMLMKDLEHLIAFANLKESAQRELCAQMKFVKLKKSEIVDMKSNSEDQWYAIIKGSVDICIDGSSFAQTPLKEGEAFGHAPYMVNGQLQAVMYMAGSDETELISVSLSEYNRILKMIENNTTRISENGQAVLVLEKRMSDLVPGSASVVSSNSGVNGDVVVSGTVDKLVERLVMPEQQEMDKFYVSDFLLTFRSFISAEDLLTKLLNFLKSPNANKESKTASKNLAQATAFAIMFWLSNHPSDFLGNPTMLDKLKEVEKVISDYKLSKEILQLKSIKEASGVTPKADSSFTLTKSLSVDQADAGTLSKVFKRKSSFAGRLFRGGSDKGISAALVAASAGVAPGHGGSGGGGSFDSSGLSFDSMDMEIIKVYRGDLSHKYIMVRKNTTAQEVVAIAIEQFGLKVKAETEYSLVMVYSTEKNSMVRPTQDNLASNLSINARYYLRNNLHPERFSPPEAIENEGESELLNMEPIEVAKRLTLDDSHMLKNISSLDYVDYLFKLGASKNDSLQKFVDRFNQINHWIATEILSTKELKRRVDLIQRIIHIAQYLQTWKNFNSLFAIVAGLTNLAVSRLKETWEKVPKRYMQSLHEFEALMNPSRNMGVYRGLLLNSTPPLCPFFPLLMKDLVFLHEGNPSKIDGLINFEKLRMIAKTLRLISDMCSITFERDDLNDFTESKRKTMRNQTSSASMFRKQYESTRMKFYVEEYFRKLPCERDQNKLYEMAASLEKNAALVGRRRPSSQDTLRESS